MSNYGLHIKTAVPYTLALALLAIYSLRAAMVYTNVTNACADSDWC